MANVAGQALFSLLPPMLVHSPQTLHRIFLVQLLPNLLATAAAWLLLKERPSHPPSAAAAAQWREAVAVAAEAKGSDWAVFDEVWHDVHALLQHTNFLYLAAGFSVGTGSVWALLILEGQLITPCGYADSVAGAAGAALICVGVASAFSVGAVMEQTKAYLPLQRGTMAAALLATLAVLASARPGHVVSLILAFCALGATLQPLNPLSLEHAAEMTFPTSVEVSSTFLYASANAFAAVLVFVLTPLLALPVSKQCLRTATPAAAVVCASMTAGLALTLLVKQEYRRQAFEAGAGAAEEGESVSLREEEDGEMEAVS